MIRHSTAIFAEKFIALAFALLTATSLGPPVLAQTCPVFDECVNTERAAHAPEHLGDILRRHQEWIKDKSSSKGERAILCNANLRGQDLSDKDLSEADLRGANLRKANLNRVSLHKADLRGACLEESTLRKADLIDADFRNGARLRAADLSNAMLRGAMLKKAELSDAVLKSADLRRAKLHDAILRSADLSGADLRKAVLMGADLSDADITDANFAGIDITDAIYEPVSAPSVNTLAEIKGLRDVRIPTGNVSGLVRLRTKLIEAGLRDLEREATFVIEKTRTAPTPFLEYWFKTVLFDWTSEYGLSPGRPLWILLGLWVVGLLVYLYPIARNGSGMGYIVQVWPKDSIVGTPAPTGLAEKDTLTPLSAKRSAIVGYALYFSLLSTFHFGWRDLNIGNWLARIHPQQYTLRATGWVRTVSGLQSLISIYLIALWVLTYFARPFQ